jgi:hypothetical protein
LRNFEKSVFHQWPAPATPLRRVFQVFAAIITLPFLAGSTACERHGNAADDVAAAHPAPSSPLTSATSAPVLLADKATSAVAATATATPAATTTGTAPSASPEPSAAGNSGPSPTPVPAPHFASAEANEYVQTYEAYIQNFRTAYIQMMKDADLSGYSRLIAQAQELQARGEQIEEELDPREREAFGKYLDAKAEEVRRITSEAL